MITIKEIAKLADVSPSTVSIVLNNKAKERKISEATIQKVLSVAAKNGYLPNMQAVGLRTNADSDRRRIIVFWAGDHRASMMVRFFKSLSAELLSYNFPYEMLLKPYDSGELSEALVDDLVRSCHGIIVCNASEADMEYLEQNTFSRPIVIYNRYSKKYPTVTVDDREIGRIPAEVFARHKKRHPLIITHPATFSGMTIRNNLFTYHCSELGLPAPMVYTCDANSAGGYRVMQSALSAHPETDCIFFAGDMLAVGALRYLNEQHIAIPEQIEIISVGNSEPQVGEFAYPSLSVINIPIEEMAKSCFQLLHSMISYHDPVQKSVSLAATYIPRRSCPE